ncbi:MAG: RNA-binding protein [Candidatus Verstraetearchaeota archaeon]|nr:RNA-binding protein [Candidatus Verstraetearchaeota archaeon]
MLLRKCEVLYIPTNFEPRQLVVPGTLLAEGRYNAGVNVYKEDDKFFSSVVGLAELRNETVTVIPLRGCYIPFVDDVVIGKVVEVISTAWMLDIRSPWQGVLFAKEFLSKPLNTMKEDARSYLDIGGMVKAKVMAFDRTRNPSLTTREPELGKIQRGTVIEADPTRVPRIIGKKGSMINLLKKESGCQIFVGQNGRVWIAGKSRDEEAVVAEAIRKIEAEAHTTGLTDRIQEYLVKHRV